MQFCLKGIDTIIFASLLKKVDCKTEESSPFQMGISVQENKWNVSNVASLVHLQNGRKSSKFIDSLTCTTLILIFFFFRKQNLTFPIETICMNCQIPFPEKNKKTILKYRLLKYLPRVLSVN